MTKWWRQREFNNGTPLQYSCLENLMDGGAWYTAVHGVTKSWTRLSDFTFTYWRRKWQPTPVFLPGESQGGRSLVGCIVQPMGSHRVGHDWSDLAAAVAVRSHWFEKNQTCPNMSVGKALRLTLWWTISAEGIQGSCSVLGHTLCSGTFPIH